MDFSTLCEPIGAAFGLVSVFLTVRNNIWCWPVGIVSVIAYGLFFLQIKLYADASLQLFFLVTGFIGWWQWLKGGANQSELPVTTLTMRQRIACLGIVAAASALCGWLFSIFTDASIPYVDSTVSGLSVTAQLLLTRRKFENWILWIVVDVASIGVYAYKEALITAALYGVFLLLAIRGFFEWKNILKRQPSAASATA